MSGLSKAVESLRMTMLETVTETLSERGPYIELETPVQFVIFDGCPATEERRTILALDMHDGELLICSHDGTEGATTEAKEFGSALNVGCLEDILKQVLAVGVKIQMDHEFTEFLVEFINNALENGSPADPTCVTRHMLVDAQSEYNNRNAK